jgi:hypothetical protein
MYTYIEIVNLYERWHVMGTPSAKTLVDMASVFFRELEEVPNDDGRRV